MVWRPMPPARVASLGADRDRVDRGHLEAGVVETPVRAGDEAEHVVITGARVEERDQAMDRVADPEPEHLGVEVGHLLRLGREKQRVPQALGQHVLGGFWPRRDADPLPASAHVDQDFRGRPGRSLRLVEQLDGSAVRVTEPQPVLGGAGRRFDDRRAGPRERFGDRVHRARMQREGDVMQPLGRRLQKPYLLLITAGAGSDKRPVLLPGLQAEVLQEALGHRQVRHFQRVVVQP
jgi:hypothetical protein